MNAMSAQGKERERERERDRLQDASAVSDLPKAGASRHKAGVRRQVYGCKKADTRQARSRNKACVRQVTIRQHKKADVRQA